MNVQFVSQVSLKIELSFLAELGRKVSKKFKLSQQTVSVVFVGSREIRKLNRIYRSHDEVTDVLSFSYKSTELLGEVIICLPVARQKAREYGLTLQDEISILFVHGLLHILGFNHHTEIQRKKMEKLEKELLTTRSQKTHKQKNTRK